jgi:hypothetical protein
MTVQQVEVVITDDVLQDRVVIDDPSVATVIEVQLPGVQGPPGSGSSAVLPSGGTAGQVLTKTGPLDANIAWAVPDVTDAELSAKMSKKNNGNVALDPEDDSIAVFRVSATDGGSEGGWVDKLQFWFSENGTDFFKTWFVDKYNQLRARAARDTESAFIAYPKTDASTVDILKVANSAGSTTFLGVSKNAVTSTVPVIAPNLVPAIVLANGGSVPGGTAAGTLVFELDA